jgi:hypothetical protein
MEQAFGGNTTHQQASTPQADLALNESRFQTILTGANSSGIATRAAANDYNVVCHFRFKCSIRALFFSDFRVALRLGSQVETGVVRNTYD